jgi:hypothetical protein
MDFPLYEELVAAPEAAQQDLWPYVMNLPSEHLETLFALMWHHAVLHKDVPAPSRNAKRTALPYQGKLFEGGKGVVFRLSDLPDPLKHVLHGYLARVIAL